MLQPGIGCGGSDSGGGSGASVAARSRGGFGAGGDSSCKETVLAGRDLPLAKTLQDRKPLHLSYFGRGPRPGVYRTG